MNKNGNYLGPSDDEILNEIKQSIGSQISDALDENNNTQNKPDFFLEKEDFTVDMGEDPEEMMTKKKMPRWLKIATIVFSVFLVVGITGLVVTKVYLGRINYDSGLNSATHEEEFETDESTEYAEVDPESIKWDTMVGNAKKVNGVFNILLLGVEAMETSEERGRTDTIMIATINTKQKSLKLTSIMRDTYVQIPGYKDNRINAAYGTGGIKLLKETITQNFNIELDGYVLINFDGFEKLINKLGGVEVTLSKEEAAYLNSTNYISDKSQRNVKVGKQTLTGNQARGYCRIRYVATEENGSGDYGRTSRQRTVLNTIFEKYKSKSATDLLVILWDILPYVTTDIKQDAIINYATTVVGMGTSELETFRIPVDKGFKGASIRGMSVLVPDLQINIDELHSFIFGDSANVNSDKDNDDEVSNIFYQLAAAN